MLSWPTDVCVHTGPEPLRAVVSGIGAVREMLGEQLATRGVERPMVVCGAQLARSPSLAAVVESMLKGCEPVVFDGSRPHTPRAAVNAGAAAARACGADALVAVGGGSTMDCARGIARLLREGLDDVAALAPAEWGRLAHPGAGAAGRPLPVFCVGTTLSFAEFLPFFGVRDADAARKRPYTEAGTVSRTVFLDAEVARHTPRNLWCETGVKALDDALSAYCRSGAEEPFLDPVLEVAVGELAAALLASADLGDVAARQHAFTAVWMTKASLPRLAPFAVPGWFSTAARHSLGAVLELPHGVGSCVALLPGLRHHEPATRARQERLHASVDWPAPIRRGSLVGTVGALLERLGVPARLGDAVDGDPRLDDVVTAMHEESPALGSRADLLRVCREML